MKEINKSINFKELRKYESLPVEIRATDLEDGQESRIITGYAVKYNSRSEIMRDYWGDRFVEEFAPGAFDEALARNDQKCLWNHDTNYPLGSVRANTLMLRSDSQGLYYEDDVPRNSWGDDALESIRRGDVDGSSFLFRAQDDQWSMVEIDGEEIYKRTIIKADLFEVSPTTFPAYPASEVNARSFKENNVVQVSKDEVRKIVVDETEKIRNLLLRTYL